MKLSTSDIVLFSGDSITHGGRGEKMDLNHIMGHGYQMIVSGELALENASARPKFINKGYSGYTMGQLLEKWEEDVLQNKPTIISILAGVNDGMQGFFQGLTAEETALRYRNNLVKAVQISQENLPGVKMIICEPFYFPLDRSDLSYRFTPSPDCEPVFLRPDRDDTDESEKSRLDSMVLIQKAAKKVAEENGCIFVPLCERFELAMANSKREYFTWDGTHPTITGHALIAKAWLDTVK